MRSIRHAVAAVASALALGSLAPAFAQTVTGYAPPPGYTAASLNLFGSSIAVSPGGLLAVGSDSPGGGATVSVYDRIGAGRQLLHQFAAPAGDTFQFISGLAFANDSTLYLSENGSEQTVFRADLNSGAVVAAAPIGSLPNVAQITLRPSDGALFAVTANSPGNGAVYSIANGTASLFASGLGNGYLGGIGFGADGALWVGDSNDPFFTGASGQLLRLDASGHLAQTISLAGGNGSGLYSFTFDAAGDIFASTGSTLTEVIPGLVPQVMPFGTFSGSFPFPTDVAFYGGTFAPFSGSGQLLVNGDFTDVGSLFVVQPASVPEPSAVCFLALLAGIGFCLRVRCAKRKGWLAVLLLPLVSLTTAARAQSASDFATKVLAYDGTGAPVGYTDPSKALGPPSTLATPTIPDNSAVVSVGTRGYITLGFAHSIINTRFNPGGYDFIVFGNALYVGGDIHKRYQEPGRVEVGVDVNGNGYDPSDPFYLLQGSANPTYSASGVDDRVSPTWGYADVTPTDGTGNPLIPDDPFQSGISPGSAGGDAFDISWAVDSMGHPVWLKRIDFVRISSVSPSWSPEVDAVAIVQPRALLFPAEGGLTSAFTASIVPEPSGSASASIGVFGTLLACRSKRRS